MKPLLSTFLLSISIYANAQNITLEELKNFKLFNDTAHLSLRFYDYLSTKVRTFNRTRIIDTSLILYDELIILS